MPLLALLAIAACNEGMQKTQTPEEEIIFQDQSVAEENTVSLSKPRTGAPPPPPPPPPPPAPNVQEIFRVPLTQVAPLNRESYAHLPENGFKAVKDSPLSTFSIDVDRASYGLVRRHLENGHWPPVGAVRTEELINYFSYDYGQPKGDAPFAVKATVGPCPWRPASRLLRVGLQGKDIDLSKTPPSNFVFLIDVSGSMQYANKLSLFKKAFRIMVGQMRPEDRVAIVTYAGSSGLALPSTPASEQQSILTAVEQLEAGGSTAGAAGITLAYEIAQEHFVREGNNRVILATDGDFNVGLSSEAALVELIEEKRASGVFLSVLGFGDGNYQDAKMEQLADHGNGNYAYIDKLQEARKVLVSEFAGTMYTIAKDVKLQLEFNPAQVAGYRLIGYENRLLNKEDFNDDTKDAGELGAGHTVTAIYELIPAGDTIPFYTSVDSLVYQSQSMVNGSKDWLTVKLRYKAPDGDQSRLLSQAVRDDGLHWESLDDDFRFAVAVSGFGQYLRKSKYIGELELQAVLDWAKAAKGVDEEGYRAAFLQLVALANALEGTASGQGRGQ
jgi:Ca-activated chloride channel family protein